MDLELQLLGDVPVARLIDRARLAEANNYSAVWVSDERFYRDVYMCLAQIATHTGRVRVGTSVNRSLYSPSGPHSGGDGNSR
jgi:alkanesulfonate monooxygenase SsuD/methylene tetrahydromethanopterin reductase-like flavin-dependent oxidoreductase (luciferase family)